MTTATSIGTPANFVVKNVLSTEAFYACPICETPAPKDATPDLKWMNSTYCANPDCYRDYRDNERMYYNSDQAKMVIRPEFHKVVANPQLALEMDWYHITRTPLSKMEFSSHKDIHIGGAATIHDYRKVSFAPVSDYFVHRLRFNQNAVLNDAIIDDFDEWEDVVQSFHDNANPNVYLYVNRLEAPGSLSIIARRDVITPVEQFDCESLPDDILNAVV